MFDEFGNPINDGCDMVGFDYSMDYPMGYSGYKPLKATTRNVQDVIAMQLGCDPYNINFVKLDDLPPLNNWKHSCYRSGVIQMNVNQFVFEDGSIVYYGVCPFFPQCNTVHYFVEKY